MTRRRAINAAMVKWNAHRRKILAVEVEDVLAEAAASRAYDLGRIAGLKEGADMSVNHGGYAYVAIRSKAATLAKKLKGAK